MFTQEAARGLEANPVDSISLIGRWQERMRTRVLIVLLLMSIAGCSSKRTGVTMQRTVLAQEWFRGVYGADPSVVDRLAADSVLITYPVFKTLFNTSVIRGKEAVKRFAVGFSERWKETEVEFHQTIADGDRVVVIWGFTGRNVGSAREEAPPTNEIHRWGGITVIEFNARGQIVAEIGEESEPGPMGRLSDSGT